MTWTGETAQSRRRSVTTWRASSRPGCPSTIAGSPSRGDPGDWQTDRHLGSDEAKAAAKQWEEAVAERGWVAPHWPQEYGGAGMSSMEHFILNEEMSKAGAPQVGGQGVAMLGPTLIVHGTDEQKAHVPDPASSERREADWAQGYSEPGAGSDLASLQTRAVARRRRVGDQRPEDLDLQRAPSPTRCSRSCARTRTRRSTAASRSSSC